MAKPRLSTKLSKSELGMVYVIMAKTGLVTEVQYYLEKLGHKVTWPTAKTVVVDSGWLHDRKYRAKRGRGPLPRMKTMQAAALIAAGYKGSQAGKVYGFTRQRASSIKQAIIDPARGKNDE